MSSQAPLHEDGITRFHFPPTLEAARERLSRVRVTDYARTRNHLAGAVTGLSPWITHGFLTLPEVVAALRATQPLPDDHKLMQELAWREYFHHVWLHRGKEIFFSLHEGPLPDHAYRRELPADVAKAVSGVAVIDRAVAELYQTGYLHNHARMWLASYLVHVRKVHWRVGADWMYAHLLDGDLASNHLSWQWVAGTGSVKPYLFNAGNVARYAPESWHSPGSVVDASYEDLEALARSGKARQPARSSEAGRSGRASSPALPKVEDALAEPVTWRVSAPSGSSDVTLAGDVMGQARHGPPEALAEAMGLRIERAQAQQLSGAWLVHPWCLADPPPGQRSIGVVPVAFFRRWAWSERRWRWVVSRMQAISERVVWLDFAPPADSASQHNPHLGGALAGARLSPLPRLWRWPDRAVHSWSRFWRTVNSATGGNTP